VKLMIVGCGFIGEIHLQAIVNNGLADVMIVDRDETRLDFISDKYGIDEKYTNIDKALEKGPDGVLICTPYNLHAEQVLQVAGRVRGVMVEKPMTFTVEEAQRMKDGVAAPGTFVIVAYCLRFSDPFIRLKTMADRGDFGNIFSIRASVSSRRALSDPVSGYIRDGAFTHGIVFDYSHEIDYCGWLAGSRAGEVMCRSRNSGFGPRLVEDTAELLIRYENGAVCSIHMDYLQTSFRRAVEIYGTGGTALWSTCDFFSPESDFIHYTREGSDGWMREKVSSDVQAMYLEQLKHFIRCLEKKDEPAVGITRGTEIMKTICACVASSDSGQWVKID